MTTPISCVPAVLAVVLVCVLPALAQQPSGATPSHSEMKRRMGEQADKAAAPTAAHKALAPFVGEFDQTSEIRLGPGEPMKAHAIEKGRWIMGGRFVQVDSAAAPDEELKGERTVIWSPID